MYVRRPAAISGALENDPAPKVAAPEGEADGATGQRGIVVYIDPRAMTRDCVGGWLQSNIRGFEVRILSDADQLATAAIVDDQIRAVLVNAGAERLTSAAVAGRLSRVGELLPEVPIAVLSDFEDAASIREAFKLGVRGFIPTSLASLVAVEAVRLVCVGGTFAPAAALLCQDDDPQRAAADSPIKGFTQRQSQILDCLRRGMANKLIAYELNMCESTVKVHIRNIMKKLNATNRTQVAYLTRGFFEGAGQYEGTAA
jgi:DNA-binding NarL/FixJ family response regulator